MTNALPMRYALPVLSLSKDALCFFKSEIRNLRNPQSPPWLSSQERSGHLAKFCDLTTAFGKFILRQIIDITVFFSFCSLLASLLQKGDKQTKTDSKISDSGGGKKMKAMIKRWLIASMIFSIPLLWSATSIAAEVNSIDIIDYGLYKTTFAHWQQAPDTHRGEIQIVGARELIKRTKIIPAKGGAEFGIRYVVNGQDEGGQVDLLVKISHSKLQSSDEWVTSTQIGSSFV